MPWMAVRAGARYCLGSKWEGFSAKYVLTAAVIARRRSESMLILQTAFSAALRSSLAGLARHLLDEGRTAASERLFGQKMPLSMLQPPSRGFQGKLENQPRRAREKELLLNSHKTATDFIFNSKDSCKDTSLYFFLIIPSVSCLTYHQTSMHLNPGYEPEAKLGAGGRWITQSLL